MSKIASLLTVLSIGGVGLLSGQAVPPPARAPRPGVSAPGVKIPVGKLEPIGVFDIPGAPDWMAIDEHVWISNSPKNNVTRIDPRTNRIVGSVTVGAQPCSGLAAGFGTSGCPTAATRPCHA